MPLAILKIIPAKVWGILAILALAGTSLWMYGNWQFERGAAEVQAKWDKDRRDMLSAHASALAERAIENAVLIEQYTNELHEMKAGHKNEMAIVKRDRDRLASNSLRLPRSICDSTGAAGAAEAEGASGGKGGAAATVVLPKRVTENLRSLLERADTIVAACRLDQKFIDENDLREKP